ncbi:SDR family oxidoreductase [Candidatus Woesearchaeota archaeon]|nr:SDR family oxidoreductase [Candidatus Woesearchaeota archaeon]
MEEWENDMVKNNKADKKVGLIIGGSGGIGFEVAKILSYDDKNSLAPKNKICLTYLSNEAKLIEKIKKAGMQDAELYNMDLRNENGIAHIIGNILKRHRKIDYVVYSASPKITHKKALDLAWSEFQEQIEVQVKGLFSIIKALSPLITQNHRIRFVILLTEACIGSPPALLSYYVTAKYALMGFVKCMALELANNNCTFNMVSPGIVKTELISNFPPKLIELAAYKNPMKRVAEPRDVAMAICFLLSDDADYLNGVNIPINGGGVLV